QVVRMSVAVVVTAWVARYLGAGRFGELSYAIAFCSLFSGLADLGLDSILVRELVHDPEGNAVTLGTAFVLKLAGGVAAFLAATAAIALLHPEDAQMRAMVAIFASALIFQSFESIAFWSQSRLESRSVVMAKSVAFFLGAGIKVALILLAASVVAFAWAGLAEAAAGAAGLAVVYGLPRLRAWQVSRRRAAGMLGISWPLIFSGVVILIYMR